MILISLFIFSTKDTLAGGFNLKSIGRVDTSGRQISHWWYSGSVATMIGEATAGDIITVSIDGQDGTTTADGEGNWTYTPASLDGGDHSVVLTSGSGSTIKFTLTMGAENVDWDAVGSGETETLPAAGVAFPTIALIMLGSGFGLTAKKLAKRV